MEATTPVLSLSKLFEGKVSIPSAVPSGNLSLGQCLGRCLITERVGSGGTGTVYRALHQTLDISVAVKVLHAGYDSQVKQLLRREAKVLAQMNHPHIVRVFDFDDTAARPYLVLEWVDGLSLSELTRQCGRLPSDRVLRIASHVGSALAEVHRVGAVHRDVKPANILMTRAGVAKLADLGLAAMRQNSNTDSNAGTIAGTVLYMAPELFRGSPADFRSDLYALGCSLYEALTGRPPFAGASPHEIMFRHVEDRPVPPSELIHDCPPALESLVLRCLAKDPSKRYGSWQTFLEAVDLAVVSAPPPPTTTIQVMQTMRAPRE